MGVDVREITTQTSPTSDAINQLPRRNDMGDNSLTRNMSNHGYSSLTVGLGVHVLGRILSPLTHEGRVYKLNLLKHLQVELSIESATSDSEMYSYGGQPHVSTTEMQ